jgi:hypothetical protein
VTSTTPPRRRSLFPREHGAYAEVLFPLLTVLLLGRVSLAGALLGVGIVAAFLLHEPILVLLGRRGSQAQQNQGHRARQRVFLLAAVAVVCAAWGLWLAGPEVRWAGAFLLPPVVLLGGLVAFKRHKTWFGEGLVALVLSCAAIPVALAGGVGVWGAWAIAGTWTTVFLVGTATVHAIFARSRTGSRRTAVGVIAVDLLLMAVATTLVVNGSPRWMLAPVPAALVSACILGVDLSPKRLMVLGWTLVSSNLITLMILLTHPPD